MLSILGFVLLLAALGGGVWFAVSHEDLVTEPDKPRRGGALSRALQRVRRGRASRRAAATADRSREGQPTSRPVVSSSAHTSTEAPLPPAS